MKMLAVTDKVHLKVRQRAAKDNKRINVIVEEILKEGLKALKEKDKNGDGK